MDSEVGLSQMALGALLSCLGHDQVLLTFRILGPSPVQTIWRHPDQTHIRPSLLAT
jgi:hypothetical protein